MAAEAAATIGRCDGRWRFRAEDTIDARAHALRPNILQVNVETLRLAPPSRPPSDAGPLGERPIGGSAGGNTRLPRVAHRDPWIVGVRWG
jgi:hypothetical protein